MGLTLCLAVLALAGTTSASSVGVNNFSSSGGSSASGGSVTPSCSGCWWEGRGFSGTDPCSGNGWVVNIDPFNPAQNAWGEPGLGLGAVLWPPRWPTPAIELTIFFFGLPPGVTVNPLPVPTGPYGYDDSTSFSNVSAGILWNRYLWPDFADFYSPSVGADLYPGQEYFVNVVFTGPVDPTTFGFQAFWTVTPEPATLVMFGTGLLGLGGVIRRRLGK